jgi:hypothetical protein
MLEYISYPVSGFRGGGYEPSLGAGGFAAGQHNAGSAEVTHAGHGISVEIIPL